MQKFEPISDIETISGIMVNFRDSLMKIVPNFEEAGFLWQEYLENESIETVIESLFETLVISRLNFIMGNTETMKDLAGYGMFYKNYHKHNFIKVIEKNNPENIYAFSYLTCVSGPFDCVNCNIVNLSGKVEGEIALKFDEVDFVI